MDWYLCLGLEIVLVSNTLISKRQIQHKVCSTRALIDVNLKELPSPFEGVTQLQLSPFLAIGKWCPGVRISNTLITVYLFFIFFACCFFWGGPIYLFIVRNTSSHPNTRRKNKSGINSSSEAGELQSSIFNYSPPIVVCDTLFFFFNEITFKQASHYSGPPPLVYRGEWFCRTRILKPGPPCIFFFLSLLFFPFFFLCCFFLVPLESRKHSWWIRTNTTLQLLPKCWVPLLWSKTELLKSNSLILIRAHKSNSKQNVT